MLKSQWYVLSGVANWTVVNNREKPYFQSCHKKKVFILLIFRKDAWKKICEIPNRMLGNVRKSKSLRKGMLTTLGGKCPLVMKYQRHSRKTHLEHSLCGMWVLEMLRRQIEWLWHISRILSELLWDICTQCEDVLLWLPQLGRRHRWDFWAERGTRRRWPRHGEETKGVKRER